MNTIVQLSCRGCLQAQAVLCCTALPMTEERRRTFIVVVMTKVQLSWWYKVESTSVEASPRSHGNHVCIRLVSFAVLFIALVHRCFGWRCAAETLKLLPYTRPCWIVFCNHQSGLDIKNPYPIISQTFRVLVPTTGQVPDKWYPILGQNSLISIPYISQRHTLTWWKYGSTLSFLPPEAIWSDAHGLRSKGSPICLLTVYRKKRGVMLKPAEESSAIMKNL